MLGVRAAGGVRSCRYPSPNASVAIYRRINGLYCWVMLCESTSSSNRKAGSDDTELSLCSLSIRSRLIRKCGSAVDGVGNPASSPLSPEKLVKVYR